MKRTLSIMAAAALFGAVAQAQVTSVNIVGYYQVDVPANGFVLTALNFQDIGGAESRSLQDIFAAGSLTGGESAGSSDSVLIWDKVSQNYVKYFLFDSNTGDPLDGKWLLDGDDTFTPTTNRINSGQGFWIRSNQSVAQVATLLGEVVDVDTNTTTLVTGFNCIGFPFSSSIPLNSTSLAESGTGGESAGSSDSLLVWDTSIQNYKKYYLFDSNTGDPLDGKWLLDGDDTFTPVTDLISLGQGAFYRTATQTDWVQGNPYIQNL